MALLLFIRKMKGDIGFRTGLFIINRSKLSTYGTTFLVAIEPLEARILTIRQPFAGGTDRWLTVNGPRLFHNSVE